MVVGAGCAGALYSARVASRGFKALLIDRKREEDLGADSFDLVEMHAIENACDGFLKRPGATKRVKGIEVFGPDSQTRVTLPGEPYILVNRRELSSYLIDEARRAGVEVLTQCIAGGVEIEGGAVHAVNTDRGSFACRIAAGASGIERVVCRDIPRGMGIPRRLRSADYISTYKETRDINRGAGGFPRTGIYEYHIGRYGGYSWVYSDGETIDIGTGVQDIQGYPDPRDIVLGYVRSNPLVGENVKARSSGRIPTRRPLYTMVASGVVVLGDSACQALPLIGRGVGGAITGALLSSDASAFALEAGEVEAGGLWSYNYNYMRERGAHLAALDCLRVFMQKLQAKDISWSLAKGAIGERELSAALLGKLELPGIQAKMKKAFRGIKGVPLLVRYQNLLRHAQRTLDHYMQYPGDYDAPDFAEWCRQADYLHDDLEKI